MRSLLDIGWDPERGEIRLGSRAVAAEAVGPRDVLRLFGPNGPLLRPLTFGERNELTIRASVAAAPVAWLADAIHDAALVSGGSETDPSRDRSRASSGRSGNEAPDFDTVTCSGWDAPAAGR